MKPITYKGYAAQIEYSDEDACFIGHIAGVTDVIGFHADNVQDLRDALAPRPTNGKPFFVKSVRP